MPTANNCIIDRYNGAKSPTSPDTATTPGATPTGDGGGGDGNCGPAGPSGSPSTAKQNYTAIRHGNDHASTTLGGIHEKGDVTAAMSLKAADGRHQISMDKDGQRKGWTTITAPSNVQIMAGADNKESQDSIMIYAKNGNILINAGKGKIIFQGSDIEFIAAAGEPNKGNIRFTAGELISLDSKRLTINAKAGYKIATSGTAELAVNGVLKLYGSLIQGVTDAVTEKDSKTKLQETQTNNTKV